MSQKRFPVRTACATSLTALLMLLLLTLPAVVQAQFYYATVNGTITITGYDGSDDNVVIPDTINGLPVTAIGNFAFANRTSLTSVTIPNSVTFIGGYAFYDCTSLTTLYGTAVAGGSSGRGTVFDVNTDGTSFTTLHSFTASSYDPTRNAYTNSDGAYPQAGLILSGNILYGTALQGGISGNGTVFSIALPVARCQHVTVSADVSCSAEASINDGSFDADGDTIRLVQSPSGPYPPGVTSVTLTVTDNHGASNSCVATVTVLDTTPPVITCPGNIVTDATSPAGAAVSFAPTASDNCSVASVTSSLGSGSTFVIGDTTVSCSATDTAGNQAACNFTVHVNGAVEQINSLIALAQSLGPRSGTAKSLIAKLQGAASALDRANLKVACGNLGAFLKEVYAQTGKRLTAEQADLMIAEATRIRAVLSCN